MATKPELEQRVEDLEGFLEKFDDALLDLLTDLRDVHDSTHAEPWSVCRNPVCRRAVDIEGLRNELAVLQA